MRRLRRTKVVATLGPASGNAEMIARLFVAGADVFRINMSHTPHDRLREMVTAIRDVEKSHGRPIGILVDLQGPKLRVGAFTGGSAMLDNGATFTFDADAKPGDAQRVHLPHPEIFEGVKAGHTLLLDDGKIRLVATAASKTSDRHPRRGRRQAQRPQGRQPARHRRAVLGAHSEGPFRSRRGARRRDRLDRAVVRAAPRRHRRGQEDHPRPRRRDGQDREAAGGGPHRRDHGPDRRHHGRARRSRRGNAAGEGAGHPEAADPRRPPGRQAGGGGDADAREHDLEPGADPRRGVRRRDRDLRRRRRGHAVGGIGGRSVSGRGGLDHEPDRRRGGKRRHLSHDHEGAACRARRRPAPMRSRRPRARSQKRSTSPPSCAGPSRAPPAFASRASGRRCRSWRCRPMSPAAASFQWPGASTAS